MALSTSLTKIDFAVIQTQDTSTFTGIISASGLISSGIVTSTSAIVGSAVTINSSGINVAGIVTSTNFVGDGSRLTNVVGENAIGTSGFTANVMSIASTGTVSTNTILTPLGSDTLMYTKYQDVVVSDSIDLTVSDGSDFLINAFQF